MRLRGSLLAVLSLALVGVFGFASSIGVRAQTTPTPASSAGGPAGVPSARFFGSVTLNGTAAPTGATVAAIVGTITCGTGVVNVSGSYFVNVQTIGGCTTPGAAVSFTVNGFPAVASPAARLPDIQGTAVLANLTATSVTPSPTPSPTPAVTAPPPPPPPPPPTAAPAAPTASPTQRPTATPVVVVPSVGPVTGLGGSQQKPSGPAAQKPSAPVAQKPGAAAAAPAARPALPNTGSGGLTHGSGSQVALLLAVLTGTFGLLLLGVRALATRRA